MNSQPANNTENATANTRRGKIARLPAHIRRQLNQRLENNEPAQTILPWLNTFPETRQILASQFDGASITPQNLSEWRQGGFREWLLLQELMDHATRLHEGLSELPACEPAALADDLATALAARYAALLNNWDGEITPDFEAKIKFLRGLSQDITRLQKSLHFAAQQNRDLARQKKQDAAEDLKAAKEDAVDRLLTNSRLDFLSTGPGSSIRHPRVAIERASSESEVAAILHRFISDSIALNPTKTASAAASSPAASSLENGTSI